MNAIANALRGLDLTPPTKAEGRTVEVTFATKDRRLASDYVDAFNEVVALTSHDAPVTFVLRPRFTSDSVFTRPAFKVMLTFASWYYKPFDRVLEPHEIYRDVETYRDVTYQKYEYANASRGQQVRMMTVDYSEKEPIEEKFASTELYDEIINDPRLLRFTRDEVMHSPKLVLTRVLNRVADWVHACTYNTTDDLCRGARPVELRLPTTIAVAQTALKNGEGSRWYYQDSRFDVQHWVKDHGWIDVDPDPLLRSVVSQIAT